LQRRDAAEEFVVKQPEKANRAEEKDMKTEELQRILGYLNIGLAIAHESGVSIGHFGDGDFLQLAQTVNGILLHSISPQGGATNEVEVVSSGVTLPVSGAVAASN
jgi:hypothetical protein